MAALEHEVDVKSPKPKGYGFLSKGNPYMTGLCRRLTHAACKKLYVVKDGNRTVGLRAPYNIISEVHQRDQATRATRRAAVERRDESNEAAFREAILRDFPEIPGDSLRAILRHTLKKRSGRVGRTGTRDITTKVRLAVTAHVRHKYTAYDTILKRKKKAHRMEARQLVHHDIVRVLRDWRGHKATDPAMGKPAAPNTKNEKQDISIAAQSAEGKTANRTRTRTSPTGLQPRSKCSSRHHNPTSSTSNNHSRKTRRLSPEPHASGGPRVQTRSMRASYGRNDDFEGLGTLPNDKHNPIVLDSSASDENETSANSSDFDSLDGFIVQDGDDDSEDNHTGLEFHPDGRSVAMGKN